MNNNEHVYQGSDRESVRRRMMALFAKARITDDMRHELVYAWTNGRTNSSSKLELHEMRDLCWKFENHFDAPATLMYIETEKKKLRSIVLTIACEVGIKEPNDFKSFNSFMMNHSVCKKEMHKYSIEELQSLVKQFRQIKRNQDKSAGTPGTKAWYQAAGLPVPSIQ